MDIPPSWDSYYLELAKTAATRSKDPSTKVGSVIVDKDNRVLALGFNGFPSGVKETPERWERPVKYDFVTHSEANALLYAGRACRGAKLYTTLYPCVDCTKLIITAGIKEVLFHSDKYWSAIAEIMFNEAGVKVTRI